MLIVFEGIGGSGKSVQTKLLADYYREQEKEVIETRCAGGTALGRKIREMVNGEVERVADKSPIAEMFLFQADMAIWVDQVLHPALTIGSKKLIICDRFTMSTRVYQSMTNDLKDINTLIGISTLDYMPALTLLIDLDPEIALQRLAKRGRNIPFDKVSLKYQENIRERYLEEAAKLPRGRVVVIDGGLPVEKVFVQVKEAVAEVVEL